MPMTFDRSLVRNVVSTTWRALLLVLALCAFTGWTFAQTTAGPSSSPLLNRDGGGVKPNVMLMIDDSGSMIYQHLPDSANFIGLSTTASIGPIGTRTLGAAQPPGTHQIWMYPTDTFAMTPVFAGVVAGSTTSSNWRQAYLRSPETNGLYYSPERRYLPWLKPDGTRNINSSPTAAPIDPLNLSGTKVNLQTVTSFTSAWCAAPGTSTSCNTTTGLATPTAMRFNPMLYYRLQPAASGGGLYSPTDTMTSYVRYDLNSTATTTFTKFPARTDCAGSSTCTIAEERRNFANWFTYYRSRVYFFKGGVTEALAQGTNTFRLGYGTINSSSFVDIPVGGVSTKMIRSGVRDFTVARKTETLAWIQALPMSGGTPLREAMDRVGQYFSRSDNRGPWSDDPETASTATHKTCRRSYHFLVTDGYWNESDSDLTTAGITLPGNWDAANGAPMAGPGRDYPNVATLPYRDDNANTLADFAMKYWNTDLRGGTGTSALSNSITPSSDNPAFWQHMSNFIIGLGVKGALNPATDLPALRAGTKTWGTDRIDDLWHAAVNSRGAYYTARDAKELTDAFTNALSSTSERELREAGVATAATILEEGNRKYVPLYRTSAWNGDIQALSLDSNGVAGAVQWTAEGKLPVWNSRNIVTWDPSTSRAISFTWSALSASSRSALGTITASFTTTFVNFLRGERANEGAALSFRVRDGVLGDFINSNPVFVQGGLDNGYANLPSIGASYPAFLTAKAARTGVLFVGANDGMLHGFKDTKTGAATDGAEVFAYVPRAVYPSLSQLATRTYGTSANYHRFFVDGPLREADAHIPSVPSTTPTWRNLLIGSTGAGARAVFALDVTDTSQLGTATVKWEISDASDADLGYVMSPIEAGVLSNGEWVAVFGNGYFSGSGDAKLMVVNLSTGAIQKLPVSAGPNNGLGGVVAVRNTLGQITKVYAGDMSGRLWRFDFNASAASRFQVAFSGSALFEATSPSPSTATQVITQPPVVYAHPSGGDLIVFGTGSLLTSTDADSTQTHSLYGVWDRDTAETSTRPLRRSSLVSRSITSFSGAGGSTFYDIAGTGVNWAGADRGWVIDLTPISGLRTIYPPQVVSSKLVLMSTVAPAANVAICESGTGRGVNFIFDVFTGLTSDYPLFDTTGDALFTSADTRAAGVNTSADGVDAIVRGNTTCTDGICYTRYSIQNTTGQMMVQGQQTSGSTSPVITDRTWRRIINPPIR